MLARVASERVAEHTLNKSDQIRVAAERLVEKRAPHGAVAARRNGRQLRHVVAWPRKAQLASYQINHTTGRVQ